MYRFLKLRMPKNLNEVKQTSAFRMILNKFLIFSVFEPCDSYKKKSYERYVSKNLSIL